MMDSIKDYLEGAFIPLEHGTKKDAIIYALLMVGNIISAVLIMIAFYISFRHNLDFITAFVIIVYAVMTHDYIKGLRLSIRLTDRISGMMD